VFPIESWCGSCNITHCRLHVITSDGYDRLTNIISRTLMVLCPKPQQMDLIFAMVGSRRLGAYIIQLAKHRITVVVSL
jgi:hypothetical protein